MKEQTLLNVDFEVIRECLATTYANVVFVKSVESIDLVGEIDLIDSITTYWKVGTYETNFCVTFTEKKEVYVSSQKCAVTDNGLGMSDYIASKLFAKEAKKPIRTLLSGVGVFGNLIENDFTSAQKILDINRHTENIDAECAYIEREYKHYEGTYSIDIERQKDFESFLRLLKKDTCSSERIETLDDLLSDRLLDRITKEDYRQKLIKNTCYCGKCDKIDDIVNSIKFEHWKSGLYTYSEYNEFKKSLSFKSIKLGKYLMKMKFSQEVIDFYATQVKTEETVYLTITSAPQFIAGMSYYAKPYSWDGQNGTSCQDVRHSSSLPQHLGGALSDDMLHIAFLHRELSDLEDMTDKMLARVLMRPIEVNGMITLIPTRYYGKNNTKDMLHYSLNQLNELLVYGNDIHEATEDGDRTEFFSGYVADGYEMEIIERVNISGTYWETVTCECPLCYGEGTVEREVDSSHGYFTVEMECGLCEGSGEFETELELEYDTYIDAQETDIIFAYNDTSSNYTFNEESKRYRMRVNYDRVARDIEKYNI